MSTVSSHPETHARMRVARLQPPLRDTIIVVVVLGHSPRRRRPAETGRHPIPSTHSGSKGSRCRPASRIARP